ncbi:MAG TPA: tetratricopeptide repeat protein [Bryobacteraceae bacterium]|nr:tetratricopeptide repeat protein [Bryobacteraceae bacterium]
MSRPQFQEAYTREQVLRVTSISERQLRIWERAGLQSKREGYSISDLKALQTLARLQQAGLGPKRIAAVFEEIRQKLAGITDPLNQVSVMLERNQVHVLVDGQRMETSSGQLLFNFDPQDISRLLSFPSQKTTGKDQAREKHKIAQAADWFQRGLELEQTGLSADEAVGAYEKALQLNPDCVGALVNLGTIQFHAKQWKQAEAYYKRALEIEPEYALGHFNLANLCDERGDLATAFHHYSAALRIAPNYADAHYNMALLCQRSGQVMKAVRHWRAYLKLDPGSSWGEVARRELAKLRDAAVVKRDAGESAPRVVS